MIKLEGDKLSLYQWDLNQRVILSNIAAGIEVHFSDIYNTQDDCPVVKAYEENGFVYANIPNILLQKSGIIVAYLYVNHGDKAWTEHRAEILVLARSKPADYVYTETEIFSYKKLEDRMSLIEKSTIYVESAKVGQIVKVTKVDEKGVPIKWEAMDVPTYSAEDVGAVGKEELPEAINTALAQAKESGEFNGPQGERGPVGPQGPQGIQGIQGERGETGATGPTGPQGPTGESGKDGAIGPQGPKGDKGDKGDAGETGPQGPVGETGKTGETGPQGPKGDKGDKGDTGAQGPQGEQGPAGKDGKDGAQGPAGPQGPAGKDGEKGADGAQGPKGDKGDKGDTGTQGPKGDTGAQGPAGKDGKDYVLTPADKTEIAEMAAEMVDVPGGGGGSGETVVHADFAQNDPTKSSYVKNRTHWMEEGDIELISGMTFTYNEDASEYHSEESVAIPFEAGHEYNVMWKNRNYVCDCIDGNSVNPEFPVGSMIALFNKGVDMTTGAGAEFVLIYNTSSQELMIMDSIDSSSEGILSVREYVEVYHHLDSKYIKDMYYTDEKYVLPETEIVPVTNMIFKGNYGLPGIDLATFKIGEKYIISVNGVESECRAFSFVDSSINFDQTVEVIVIGDYTDEQIAQIIDQSATDILPKSFSIGISTTNALFSQSMAGGPYFAILSLSEPTNENIVVSIFQKEIHHIPPKYIKDMYYTETSEDGNEGNLLFNFEPEMSVFASYDSVNIVVGSEYKVTFIIAGQEFMSLDLVCETLTMDGVTFNVLANVDLMTGNFEDVEMPFAILMIPDDIAASMGVPYKAQLQIFFEPAEDMMNAVMENGVLIRIEGEGLGGEIIHKIPNKYLDLNWVPAKLGEESLTGEEEIQFDGKRKSVDNIVGYRFCQGENAIIYVDGVRYECQVIVLEGSVYFGNLSPLGLTNDCPVFVMHNGSTFTVSSSEENSDNEYHTIRIARETYNKIPFEFFPDALEVPEETGYASYISEALRKRQQVRYGSFGYALAAHDTDANHPFISYATSGGFFVHSPGHMNQSYNGEITEGTGDSKGKLIAAMIPATDSVFKAGDSMEFVRYSYSMGGSVGTPIFRGVEKPVSDSTHYLMPRRWVSFQNMEELGGLPGIIINNADFSQIPEDIDDIFETVVDWMGTKYTFDAIFPLGNMSIVGDGPDTGEPFLIVPAEDNQLIIIVNDTKTGYVSIQFTKVSKKLHERYVPDSVKYPGLIDLVELGMPAIEINKSTHYDFIDDGSTWDKFNKILVKGNVNIKVLISGKFDEVFGNLGYSTFENEEIILNVTSIHSELSGIYFCSAIIKDHMIYLELSTSGISATIKKLTFGS